MQVVVPRSTSASALFLSEVNSVTGVFELANNNSVHVGKSTEPEAEHDFISSPPQAGL